MVLDDSGGSSAAEQMQLLGRAGNGGRGRAASARWRKQRNDAKHEWQADDGDHDEDEDKVPEQVRPGMGQGM